jgi:hypothetical protein
MARQEIQTGQFQIESKLTQSYRYANPVGGQSIAPLRDNLGVLHIFTLGSNNHLYDVYQDPASDTGWSKVDMQFNGSGTILTFAAGVGSDGITMVFVADSDGTLYSIRDQRWSGWNQFSTLVGETPVSLKVCHDNAGNLICTVSAFDAFDVFLYWTDYTQQNSNNSIANVESENENDWLVQQLADYQVGLDASSGVPNGLSTWLVGTCRQTVDQSFVPAGKKTPWQNGTDVYWASDETGGFTRVALAPNPSNPQDSMAFAIKGSDNGLYWIDAATQQLVNLSGTVQLAEIKPYLDKQELVGVIGLGADGRLYHVRQDPNSETGWTNMVSLNDQTLFAAASTVIDRDGNVVAFALDRTLALWQIWRDPTTQDWHFAKVDVGTGALEEFSAYVTRIDVLDVRGVPQGNAPVDIWSSGPTPATINGTSVALDPDLPTRCRADAMGRLTVIVDADALATPTLTLLGEFMDTDDRIVVEPNGDIQAKLHSLTRDDLLQAKTYDRQPITLLTGQFNDPGVADAVAQACNQAMAMAGAGGATTGAAARRYLTARTSSRAIRCVAKGAPATLGRIDLASVPDRHWRLCFENGIPKFSEFTRSEAVALMTHKRATLRRASDWYDLDVDWGEIWDDVTDAVTEIVDIVVTTVIDPIQQVVTEIQAQITLLIDGVEAFFDATISFVEQAFDVVGGIFDKIKVGLEQLWQWLSFLFKWSDIARTAEVVAHILNTALDFSASAATHAKVALTAKIADLSTFVQNDMDSFIASLAGNQTIGDWIRPVTQPEPIIDARIGDNPLLDALLSNFGQAKMRAPRAGADRAAIDPIVQKLLDTLNQFVDQFSSGDGAKAFQEAIQYFASIKEDPDNALVLMLQGVLKIAEGIALIGLQTLSLVLGAFLDAVVDLITTVRSLLNEEWTIPVVSDIYEQATGKGLRFTPLELCALIIATPVTSIYKATFDSAPFPDEEAVTAVTNLITVGWLDQRAWSGGPSLSPPSPELQKARFICDIAYAINFLLRCPVEYIINQSPVPVRPAAAVNIVQRLISSGLSVPWLMSDQSGPAFGDDAQGWEQWIWATQLIFGPGRGALLFIFQADEVLPDAGDFSLSAWGAIHIILEAVLAAREAQEEKADPVKTTERMLVGFGPQFLKFLHTTPAQTFSDGASLFLCAWATVACEGSIMALHVERTLRPALIAAHASPA